MFSSEEASLNPVKSETDKCIVLYEDDPEILFLCKLILKKEQYGVITFTTCDNVVEDLIRIKPDLVIMDLWIPEIGGEKAVTLFKSNPATRHIPVLLFSANDKIEEICEKVNADGCIAKPFDIYNFKKIIAETI